jgi:hypothetical protein
MTQNAGKHPENSCRTCKSKGRPVSDHHLMLGESRVLIVKSYLIPYTNLYHWNQQFQDLTVIISHQKGIFCGHLADSSRVHQVPKAEIFRAAEQMAHHRGCRPSPGRESRVVRSMVRENGDQPSSLPSGYLT